MKLTVKSSYDYKNFKIHYKYYIEIASTNNIYYSIKGLTYYKKSIFFNKFVHKNEHDITINNIKKLTNSDKVKNIIFEDFGRCVACKKKIDQNYKKYIDYGIFCSYHCKKYPIADKCLLCKKDINREKYYKFEKKGYCTQKCLLNVFLKEQNYYNEHKIVDIILSYV